MILVSHDRDFLDRVVTSVIAAEGNGKWIEYAGGYSDMMSQRGGDLGPRKRGGKSRKNDTSEEGSAQKAKPAVPNKMTFKDKHALKTLPARMEEIQKEIDTHQAILADPDLFRSDPVRFDATAKAMQAAQTALAVAEEQWLELEMKREELEG